jgi:broad specificity phosphatase PhoE
MADAQMDAHGEAIEPLRREFDEFRRDMNEFRRETNQRFTKVDERFDRVDGRFDSLEQRVEDKYTGLRVLIESVQGDIKLILEYLVPTMRRVDNHETRITALERGGTKPS